MQTDHGSLTKISWHFVHVWWEACGARLLAASDEGLYQMEICSLIDTSRYKPHWQRRWQSGETWVVALHGTEQKNPKKRQEWKRKHDTNHYFGKKKKKGNNSRPLDSRGFWQWASAGPPWKTPNSTLFSQSVNGRKRLQPKHWRPLQADRTNSLKSHLSHLQLLNSHIHLEKLQSVPLFFVVVVLGLFSFLLKFQDMQALVACDCGFGSVLYPVQTGNTLPSVIWLSQLYVNLKRSPVPCKKKTWAWLFSTVYVNVMSDISRFLRHLAFVGISPPGAEEEDTFPSAIQLSQLHVHWDRSLIWHGK